MWNQVKSLRLSLALVRILFVLIIILACCTPTMVHWYDVEYGHGVGLLEGSVYFPLIICLYLAAICGEVCLFHLAKLLQNLKNEIVFVAVNCQYLRIISWCCFLASIPFFIFGFWRFLSFIVALAAGFFGLILRVLKNVFDKAVALQEENDYTI
ncbi:MAG: DUF2975 domain-containing protein [Oscillospiraceae bacterium]|nr:DUF2975 domain-containing protein [Oscillospiraceae bacterium]